MLYLFLDTFLGIGVAFQLSSIVRKVHELRESKRLGIDYYEYRRSLKRYRFTSSLPKFVYKLSFQYLSIGVRIILILILILGVVGLYWVYTSEYSQILNI